jgi:lipopolysaccharide biosynthesis protein
MSISIIYAYYEKNEMYRMNLVYFLKNGYIKTPRIDYCFIVNGTHTINFPKENNIKVIQRENKGFDFQGYYVGLMSLRKKYDYYLFLNASVRGPYLPPYLLSYCKWYQPLIDLLRRSPKTKLVGPTINIQPPMDSSKYHPHVQSYCFMMDNECMTYLLMTTHLWDMVYDQKHDVIMNQEIAMSAMVLQKGWTINCLIPEYQSIDYHMSDFSDTIHSDILWPKNELGRVVHPYETIFAKTDRGINVKEIETLTEQNVDVNDLRIINVAAINIAICFHLGYGNMWPQFANYIQNVYRSGYNVDLYVTYQRKTDPLRLIKKQYPNTIFLQTIRGCDTGAFLLQLEQIYNSQKQYNFILKLHTKKKEDWRKALLDLIAGTSEQVRFVCDTFNRNAQVGMIGGSTQWLHRPDNINEPLIGGLCRQLGINVTEKFCFMAGTIFWVRWSILRQFIQQSGIKLRQEYEKCELGYLLNDKPTYMHSWERLFGYIVGHMGHQTLIIGPVGPVGPTEIKQHIITRVTYGLSEKESVDITDILRKDGLTEMRNVNTTKQWGDPYPLREKKLFIDFSTGEQVILAESVTRIIPNNFVIVYNPPNLVFKTEEYNNLDTSIMIHSSPQCGQYCLTFFDWSYYYDKYKPWLSSKTHRECLQHYIKYGRDANLSTFEPGRSLLEKYKIKLLAYYVPYNSTSVSSRQPRMPPDNYDPLDINLLRRQVMMANKAGITGFCFQHYWDNGPVHKEPAELFLKNSILNLNFCFSWVTETITNNQSDWVTHFNYLLPFFRDNRYIKINKSPVFLINSKVKSEIFVKRWNQLSEQYGLASIFFIDVVAVSDKAQPHQNLTVNNPSYLQNMFPMYCQNNIMDYPRLYRSLINHGSLAAVYFREVCVGFNRINPRCFYSNQTANSVYCVFKSQFEKIMEQPNPNEIDNLVFIHSWNDWGNQMVIEPDKSVNRSILTAITNVTHQYNHPHVHNKIPDLIF